MEKRTKVRMLRRLRLVFRWTRITVWFAIFLALVAVAYLHLIGLPDFLKRPLLSRLRERGFEAEFSSARLGWGPDVVIENASFHRQDHPLSPRLSAARTQVMLSLPALLHRRVKVDALTVHQGSLELPVSGALGDFLSVNEVSVVLKLLTNDTIVLEEGSGRFHGVQISVHGTVTNFMAARDWSFWASAGAGPPTNAVRPGPAPLPETENSLRRFARILDQIHFSSPPELTVGLGADGRDPDSLRIELDLRAEGAASPWGEIQALSLAVACSKPFNPGPGSFLKLRLTSGAVLTPQAAGKNIYLTAELAHSAGTNLEAAVNFSVTNFEGRLPAPEETNQISAARLRGNGGVTFQRDSLAFLAAAGSLRGDRVATPWGSAEAANATCRCVAVEGSPAAGPAWGVWAAFNRREVEWQSELVNFSNPKIQFAGVQCAGRWRAPELILTNLEVSLYGGAFTGRAWLDVARRELEAGIGFDFELRQLADLLTPAAKEWLAPFDWEHPPKVAAEARLVLPPWTNRPDNWWAAVLPTLQIAGDFSVGPASYRQLKVNSLRSRFTYTNEVWDLSRLRVLRPEGALEADFTSSDATQDFFVMLDSTLDPGIVRPLLPEKQQPLLNEAVFSDPPQIHGEIRGNWNEPGQTTFTARVAATNFTAHGEKVDSLTATVHYTNLEMQVTQGDLWKDGGELTAPLVEADFRLGKISMTNVLSTLDSRLVPRVLGPIAPEWLSEVGFDTPPTVHLNGSFAPADDLATDLHLAVTGRNFRYTNAVADQMSGQVNWRGRSVAVTNVQGNLYGGALDGWGVFDYSEAGDTDFRGQFTLAKIDLHQVVRGLFAPTNRIEGALDGHLAITGGNSRSRKSWIAHGDVSVKKALLWDIKLFGVFSPILNAIKPGAGDSRAYQAGADFVVTNAMVATDNMEIQSTGFRLLYHGTLSFDRELSARVEARPLRGTPVVGPLFSGILTPLGKLFEFKVSGTVDAPIYKPVYVPEFLLLLMRPFHTLKELRPSEPAAPATPAEPPKVGN